MKKVKREEQEEEILFIRIVKHLLSEKKKRGKSLRKGLRILPYSTHGFITADVLAETPSHLHVTFEGVLPTLEGTIHKNMLKICCTGR